jgi:GTPase-activator protein for Ras-like GTPase/Galactose oxidase, central domain/BTB/POZ domain
MSQRMNANNRERYARLICLLVRRPDLLGLLLMKRVDGSARVHVSRDKLAKALVDLNLVTNTGQYLIYALLRIEFERTKRAEPLLRGTSLATKAERVFCSRVGQSYLCAMLGPLLRRIVGNKQLDLRVNNVDSSSSSVAADGAASDQGNNGSDESEQRRAQRLSANRHRLKKLAQACVNTITSAKAADAMPDDIRAIAAMTAMFAAQRQPDSVLPLVGSFLLLRFFNPAIVAPEQCGVLPSDTVVSPQARGNLVALSKVLQKLANNVRFDESDEYAYMNEFIDLNQQRMSDYLRSVVVDAEQRFEFVPPSGTWQRYLDERFRPDKHQYHNFVELADLELMRSTVSNNLLELLKLLHRPPPVTFRLSAAEDIVFDCSAAANRPMSPRLAVAPSSPLSSSSSFSSPTATPASSPLAASASFSSPPVPVPPSVLSLRRRRRSVSTNASGADDVVHQSPPPKSKSPSADSSSSGSRSRSSTAGADGALPRLTNTKKRSSKKRSSRKRSSSKTSKRTGSRGSGASRASTRCRIDVELVSIVLSLMADDECVDDVADVGDASSPSSSMSAEFGASSNRRRMSAVATAGASGLAALGGFPGARSGACTDRLPHWFALNARARPSTRSSLCAAQFGFSVTRSGNELVLFGGADENRRSCGVTAVLHLASLRWTLVPSSPGPSSRFHHSAVEHAGSVYVFGGTGADTYNNLWRYDCVERKWSGDELRGGGASPAPAPRFGHTATVARGRMYVFGGKGYDRRTGTPSIYNQLHTYTFARGHWQNCTPLTDQPQGRFFHSACAHGNAIYFFGGQNSAGKPLNDFVHYNLDMASWSATSVADGIGWPAPRWGHTAVVVSDSMYVIGGRNELTELGSVYAFSFVSRRWTELDTFGDLPPDMSHHACVLASCGSLFLLSGRSRVEHGGSDESDSDVDEPATPAALMLSDESVSGESSSSLSSASPVPPRLAALRDDRGNAAAASNRNDDEEDDDSRSNSNDDDDDDDRSSVSLSTGVGIIYQLRFELVPAPDSARSDGAYMRHLVDKRDLFSDVTFVVNGRPVHAHKVILYTRECESMLASRASTTVVVDEPSISHSGFLALMSAIYVGSVEAPNVEMCAELLTLVDRFRLEQTNIRQHVAYTLSRYVSREHVIRVFALAIEHRLYGLLIQAAVFVLRNRSFLLRADFRSLHLAPATLMRIVSFFL